MKSWPSSSNQPGCRRQQPQTNEQKQQRRNHANRLERHAPDEFVTEEHRWHIGEHHADGRAHRHRNHLMKAGAQRDGGDLRLVAHFDQEESDGRGQASAKARGFVLNIVKLVRYQRSEERSVGKEGVSTCRSWWSAYI